MPRWISATGRVASWLVTLLAAALLIAFIGWVTLPRILDVQAVVVLTGSMEPALPIGSIAFVEKMGAQDAPTIATGDILTFYRPDVPRQVLVTHRVSEILRDGEGIAFKTRGDANNDNDDWLVRPSNVADTVSTVIPHVGHVTDVVRGRNGFLALMAIPGALIIFGEVGKIRRELKVMRQEKSPS